MKVAHVSCVFPPYKGGIGNVAFHYAKTISSIHDVTVFTPEYSKDEKIETTNFKTVYLKPVIKFGKGGLLLQLISKLKKFDIVHLHYPFFGGAEVVWLSKIFGAKFKLVIHYHMDTDDLALIPKILSIPSKIIKKSLFKRADAVTAASLDYIRNSQIRNSYENFPKKFIEIPFGVDQERFKYIPKEENKIKTILFVSSIDKAHYFKGVEVLLNSLKGIDSDFKLQIVGDGDLKSHYIELSEKLGISNKVEFLGRVSDKNLPKYYQNADIFVLPSINKHEAFGLVLLEAMACGTPVIASNLPGVRSVFNNGIEGLLVEPKSVSDLNLKISTLLNDDILRKNMSKNALALIRNKYSWANTLKSLKETYKNI